MSEPENFLTPTASRWWLLLLSCAAGFMVLGCTGLPESTSAAPAATQAKTQYLAEPEPNPAPQEIVVVPGIDQPIPVNQPLSAPQPAAPANPAVSETEASLASAVRAEQQPPALEQSSQLQQEGHQLQEQNPPQQEKSYQLNAQGQLSPVAEPAALHVAATNSPMSASNRCPAQSRLGKSLVFFSFARVSPKTSNLGGLYQVEQQLPQLLGVELSQRHSLPAPLVLEQTFISARQRGELDTQNQLQTIARNQLAQYFVNGELEDMSLSDPSSVVNPGIYTRFVSGLHDLFHFSSFLDSRSRLFSFKLQARDSVTGELVFSRSYQTFGTWNAPANANPGFGSAEFWHTDYGNQIQQLTRKAAGELATALACQPFYARVDARTGQTRIVIHSGALNGVQVGDALELYQLVYEPVTGHYQRYQARLLKRSGKVFVKEVYPDHSLGQVSDEPLLSGLYVVKAL